VITGDPSVQERFGLFVTTGFNGDNWTLTDSMGLIDTGVDASETTSGAQFKFSLTSTSTYQFELTRISDGHLYFTGTGSLAASSAGPIDSLEITMFGNGSGNGRNGPAAQSTGEREFFFKNIRIESEVTSLLGDYNRNGRVDAADYVVWRKNDGSPQGYNEWRTNFGRTTGAGSQSDAIVPEPTNWILLLPLAILASRNRYPSNRKRS
jgi:hypothetical protein